MSSELTDKAIDSSKKAEEMASKPVLSSTIFIDNVTKLKNHFEEIDDYRKQIKIEAVKEQELFKDAKTKLEEIKVMSKENHEELAKELNK
jgi:predicted secreted protein